MLLLLLQSKFFLSALRPALWDTLRYKPPVSAVKNNASLGISYKSFILSIQYLESLTQDKTFGMTSLSLLSKNSETFSVGSS